LARASDTAREIAKYHSGIPIKFIKELREIYLGEWQGKSKKELGFTSKKGVDELFPKDGEGFEKLFDRASKFLHEILSKHQSDTVLFVGHNGINKAIIAVITGKKPEDINSIEKQHNTSISIFEIDEDKNHKIHLFNCIKHLSTE